MRPYIICHMMQSLDGRVACDMVDKISGDEYYTALDALGCQAFIEGKHSYQIHLCGFKEFNSNDSKPIGKETWCRVSQHDKYNVSVDTLGTLMWNNGVDENHICIVSEQATESYLKYLESLGISYIAVGKKQIDLARAMEILNVEFDIERVAVVGGGKVNGGFLTSGLIDEVSAMIAPGIDGRKGQPALFDGVKDGENYLPIKLKFKEVSTFSNGVVWVRYSVSK